MEEEKGNVSSGSAPKGAGSGEPAEAAPTWAPKRIYLQPSDEDADGEVMRPDSLEALDGATWCQEQINDFDVEYIRADLAQAPTARPAPAEASEAEQSSVTPVLPMEDVEPSGTASLRGAARLGEPPTAVQPLEGGAT